MKLFITSFIIASVLFLSGCGQRGALYLPEKSQALSHKTVTTTAHL